MKYLFLIFLCILTTKKATACDACASFSGGLNMGITPMLKNNTLLTRYQLARFNTLPFAYSNVFNTDITHSFDIQSRISLNNRWQLNIVVPYNIYNQKGEYGSSNLSGQGDISLVTSFIVLNDKISSSSNLSHLLMVNTGLKLPTGQSGILDKSGKLFNPRMQPGSGSFDYIGQMNYIIKFSNNSIVTELGGRLNTMNKYLYKIGNQYRSSIMYSRWVNLATTKLLLNTGYSFDHFSDDFSKSEIYHGMHGRTEHSAIVGMDLFYKKFIVNINFQKPFHKIEAQNLINNIYNFSVSLGYGF